MANNSGSDLPPISPGDAQWLAGAFSAYGLMSNAPKSKRVSIVTTSINSTYVELVSAKAGGRGIIVRKGGRWQWLCAEPNEIQDLYRYVGPWLEAEKVKVWETVWKTWRTQVLDAGRPDPGWIDGTDDDAEAVPVIRRRSDDFTDDDR